ncbi:MAG: ASKHA domain-containing protein [Planctomycetes bacterium]|nr:ASKHA domain-containing protein [Planctomycetota bacterium]
MKHFRVVFQPEGREISIHQGATLVEAAGQAGIFLMTPCAGRGTCRKCTVLLYPSGQPILACQHRVESDLTVVVPPESRFYEHKILDQGIPAGEQIHPTLYPKYSARAGTGAILGVAVDIGTTTVVAKLLDMVTGRCLATQAMLNPQTRFGDDVVSRINYAQSDAHLTELHNIIVECVNALIRRLCRRAGTEALSIYEASIVGNTTMNHLFLRLPVEQLGRAPYRAWSVEAQDIPPAQLNLEMNPAGNIHCAENIAGFVGADTTAVALAVDMDLIEDRVLAVDIGTNGEIVLGTRDKLYAASCAAGPALEGARIRYGSRAVDGAIEAVVFDEDISLDVIGKMLPHSICGSGLIDAVAVLVDLGVVDATGRFTNRAGGASLPKPIASRILEFEGQPAFCLAWNEQTSQPGILLTQRDIREVQLAKAAIRAGIRILMNKLGLSDADIDRVLLAGAFGNYIRPSSAVRIGLLPNVPLDRIEPIGNAAATGAEILLISEESRERAARLARRIQYVEIAHEANFADVFADAMFLNP